MNDYKNATHYPLDLPPEGWAWGFLRRNPLYQKDYKKWLDLEPYVTSTYSPAWLVTQARQEDRKATMYEPERGPNETFLEWQHRCQAMGVEPQTFPISAGLARKWQLECLVDPATAYSPQIRFRKPEFPVRATWDDVENYFVPCAQEGGPEALPDPRRPLIAYDLQRPLQPQFKRAEAEIKRLAADYVNANGQGTSKWLPIHWQRQLRVLDGLEANASRAQIASVLFPTEDPEHGEQHVWDVKHKALENRAHGYRRILEK